MLAKNVIIEAQRKGKQQLIFISNGLVLSDKAIKVGQYLSSLFDSEREFDLKICHNNKNFVLKCQPSLYEANIFFSNFYSGSAHQFNIDWFKDGSNKFYLYYSGSVENLEKIAAMIDFEDEAL